MNAQTNINTSSSKFLLSATSSPQPGDMQINEKDFYSFLSIKQGLSENSIRHCMIRVKIINEWLTSYELDKESVENFFMALKNKGLKNNSLNTYRFVLNQLSDYCKDRGLDYSFMEGFKSFKKTRPDIIILTLDEIELLINTPLSYGKFHGNDCSFLDFRYRTTIEFLALTGVRFSEAANLKIKHLDLHAGRAILVQTKTNENRSVYFAEPLASHLKELIKDLPEEDHVFRNSNEKRMKESDFSYQLKRRAIKAGIIKRVYPHLFRHSFATQLLISGIDVAIVSKILGHKDIRTTVENYLHLADETLKDATFMHPLIRKNVNPSLIIKSVRDSLEGYHFETDKRFKYSIVEDENSFKFELQLKTN